jgi:hypothetical protein
MIAAEALAAGLDTPMLRELAGLPRNADTRDIRDLATRIPAISATRSRKHSPRPESSCLIRAWHGATRCVGWRRG